MDEYKQIEKYINKYKGEKKKIFTTSSFQTHSIVFLHILSQIDNSLPIYFTNTGYLFPETLKYKEKIVRLLQLNVKEISPSVPKYQQKDANGKLIYTSDPDYCCFLNKVQPLNNILKEYDVWINGIRADQSIVRKEMKIEEQAPHNVIRYHPMLSWTKQEIFRYIAKEKIPSHPLDEKGYVSIGCEPCTRRIELGDDERTGRWFGMNKVECGINTSLLTKK